MLHPTFPSLVVGKYLRMLAKRAFFEGIDKNEWSRIADQVLLVASVIVGSSAGQPRHTFSSRPIGISPFKVIDTFSHQLDQACLVQSATFWQLHKRLRHHQLP